MKWAILFIVFLIQLRAGASPQNTALGNKPVDKGRIAALAGTEPPPSVDPRTIRLPIVDGRDLRFTRLSTDEGLSQTKIAQIV